MVMTAQVPAQYNFSLAEFKRVTLLKSCEFKDSTSLRRSVSIQGGRSGVTLTSFWVLAENNLLSNLSRRIFLCSRHAQAATKHNGAHAISLLIVHYCATHDGVLAVRCRYDP